MVHETKQKCLHILHKMHSQQRYVFHWHKYLIIKHGKAFWFYYQFVIFTGNSTAGKVCLHKVHLKGKSDKKLMTDSDSPITEPSQISMCFHHYDIKCQCGTHRGSRQAGETSFSTLSRESNNSTLTSQTLRTWRSIWTLEWDRNGIIHYWNLKTACQLTA